MLFVAQRVAGRRLSQAYDGDDFACIGLGNFHSLRRMHLQNLGNSFPFPFRRVVNVRSRLERSAVNADVSKPAHKRVGNDFERKTAEGLVVVGFSLLLLVGVVGVEAHNVVDVYRRGKIIGNGVQQKLNALVFVSRAAENRIELQRYDGASDTRLDFFDGNFLAVKELFHQHVVATCDELHQFGSRLLGCRQHICGNFALVHLHAGRIVVEICLHLYDVDNPLKILLLAYRQLEGHGVGFETVSYHAYHVVEVGAVDVHLVDKRDSRNLVFCCLMPHCLALGLHAALGAEHRDSSVKHSERALHLNGKVNVSRRVYKVDAIIHSVVPVDPMHRRCGAGYGYASLLLLLHGVHNRRALVRFA